MPTPANKELYERIKKEVYEEMPKHSAYRSSILVKRYKDAGGKYLGKKKEIQASSDGIKRVGRINAAKRDIRRKGMYTDQPSASTRKHQRHFQSYRRRM